MRKQAVLDWTRRGLIVLLLLSAVLLLRQTGYYDGFRSMLATGATAGESAQTESAERGRATVILRPVAVTVSAPEGGARYGTAYDAGAEAVLRRFSIELGEALGSADDPAEQSEAEFREALSGCCVCFHFPEALPLRLLADCLGTDMSGASASDSAALVCLSATETETALGYRTPEGRYFTCATAAKPDALRVRTLDYPPNGAQYAWETDRIGDGDALLLPGAPNPAAVKSAVTLPLGAERDMLLATMGMNSFVASSYSESDGTVVYVNDETSLRISPNGTAVFRRAASPETRGSDSMAAAADAAWHLAERSVGAESGDGVLYLAGVSYNESQHTYTVLADYMVDGVPVRLASGHAAELVMRDGTVVQAQLQFRRFTRTEEQTTLLPWLQAAAIALAQDGEPELVYADAGDATECMWVIADG
jgi:hypothetical protein